MTKAMTNAMTGAFVIIAEFEVRPDKIDRFLELAAMDARQSLATEPGCEQFDVTVLEDDPSTVVLYEVYRDAAAFEAHLETPHLKAFRDELDQLVSSRNVRRFTRRYPAGETS